MGTQYRCKNQQRTRLVREHPTLNGIDHLEVLDQETPTGSPRQRTLLLHCFKNLPALRRENVRLEGGVRVRPVEVEWAFLASEFSTEPADAGKVPNNLVTPAERDFFAGLIDKARVLVVRTGSTGDFSTYTLRREDSVQRGFPLCLVGSIPNSAILGFSSGLFHNVLSAFELRRCRAAWTKERLVSNDRWSGSRHPCACALAA